MARFRRGSAAGAAAGAAAGVGAERYLKSRAAAGAERAQRKRAKNGNSEGLGRRVSVLAQRPSLLTRRSSKPFVRRTSRDTATAEVGRLATLFLGNAGVKLDLMDEVTALAPVKVERKSGKVNNTSRGTKPANAAMAFVQREVEEDRRWVNVEEATGEEWRSCSVCGFLCWGGAERCEACAMRLPGWDRHAKKKKKRPGPLEDLASEEADTTADEEETEHTVELRVYCVRSEPVNPMRAMRSVQQLEKLVLKSSRIENERMLFEGLDRNSAGVLGSTGMLRFARLCGFDEQDSVWEGEYARICKSYNIEKDLGVDFETFSKLLRNKSFEGYCTDGELRSLLLQEDMDLARFAKRGQLEWDVTPMPSSACNSKRSNGSSCGRRSSWVSGKQLSMTGERTTCSVSRRRSSVRFEDGHDRSSRRSSRRSSENSSMGPRASSDSYSLVGTDEENEESGSEGSSFEDSSEEEEDEDPLMAAAREHQAESLDESPAVGTMVEVFCDDGLWHLARVVSCRGDCGQVVYMDDEAEDEIDFSRELARLAEAEFCFDGFPPKSAKRRSRRPSELIGPVSAAVAAAQQPPVRRAKSSGAGSRHEAPVEGQRSSMSSSPRRRSSAGKTPGDVPLALAVS